MAVTPLTGSVQTVPLLPGSVESPKPTGAGFGESLARLVQSVEDTNGEANAAVSNMLRGEGDVHDAMIALQRADLTLQLTVQVRNKLVQAYQEIMRMPV